MKKIFFLSAIVFLCICSNQSAAQEHEKITTRPPSEIPAQGYEKSVLPSNMPAELLFGKLLSKVTTTKSSFNPNQGEEVTINYHLIKQAKVILHMYDPDRGLIRTIESEKSLAPGDQSITWNGKDMDGKTVPDEAYFFTIIAEEEETGVREIYDPTTFSGGLEDDITTANVSPETGTITYKLPQMSRVMIRIGVQGGSLLNTLVDWKPRVKGTITEYWNGKDKDNVVDLYNHPKFKMIIAYFTLPENSIIAYGNKAMTYKDYKKSLSTPVKEERSSSVSNPSPHYRLSRLVDYSPDVKVNFENVQGTDSDGTIILKGKTMVKVDLEKEDKGIFQNQQFEICFFLNHEFYAEDEAGYTPFNWVWDLSNVSEGEHVFTVNLSSFKDQIGVFSRKIRIVK